MELSFEMIVEFLRANFFYDLKSSIISICFLFTLYFLWKLMKDNGEKVYKTLKYLTGIAISFGVFVLLY